jgi:hypothetical protein
VRLAQALERMEAAAEAVVDAAVTYGLAHRDISGVTHLGIDEISRKRGHVYVTNVYDSRGETPPRKSSSGICTPPARGSRRTTCRRTCGPASRPQPGEAPVRSESGQLDVATTWPARCPPSRSPKLIAAPPREP